MQATTHTGRVGFAGDAGVVARRLFGLTVGIVLVIALRRPSVAGALPASS